jgi:hypothetical protein
MKTTSNVKTIVFLWTLLGWVKKQKTNIKSNKKFKIISWKDLRWVFRIHGVDVDVDVEADVDVEVGVEVEADVDVSSLNVSDEESLNWFYF